MTTSAGDVVTDVLRYVNDVEASGHSRSLCLSVVSKVQRFVNYVTGAVVASTTMTVEQDKMVYAVTQEITDYLRPVLVRFRGDQLVQVSLDDLNYIDMNWPRAREEVLTSFTPVGLDLLILYPAVKKSESVDIIYVQDTGDIPGEATNMSLPDHMISPVVSMAAGILFIRQRDIKEGMEAFSTGIQEAVRFRDE